MRRRLFLLGMLLATAACAPAQSSFSTSLHRFGDGAPAVILTAVPEELQVATIHPTLGGPEEINVETDFQPIALGEIAATWGDPAAVGLTIFRPADLKNGGAAEPWVIRLESDPRRASQEGYRLLETYRPPAPIRDPNPPDPQDEASLNDCGARRCLIRSEAPLDNLPRPIWYAFDPEAVAEHFQVDHLLLISVESIVVIDTGRRPRLWFRLGFHLVDLQRPLLLASFVLDIDGGAAAGPAGWQAAVCNSLAELRADDWLPVRESLAVLGRRVGPLIAAHLGWIGPDRLAESAAAWREENAVHLRNAGGER